MTGISVDLLIAASKAVGDEIDSANISLLPWDQAYKTAVSNSNSVIFSTVKTEPRDNLFYWVGPIRNTHVVLLAREDANIQIDKIIALSNYKIGVIRDDIGEQLLLAKGIPLNTLHEAPDPAVLLKLLYMKRVDMIAYEKTSALFRAATLGLDANLFKTVMTLKKGESYFAVNKGTDYELVKKLQTGIDKVKHVKDASGETQFDKILKKYH